KDHWKVHKKECASLAASSIPQPVSSPPTNPARPNTTACPSVTYSLDRAGSGSGNPPKNLSVAVEKPFHKLQAKTWLHGRSERDVYMLLIDCYRLKLEDDYKFEGDADIDSIYGGCANSSVGFMRFLRLAEKRQGLLPSWWSQSKAEECLRQGMGGGWSSLAVCIEKQDIIEHYEDSLMPMQLRMLGEQICLRGPGGMCGTDMLKFQVQAEANNLYRANFDTSKMFR
ncbi:hypothetical protein BGX28_000612, partial [Mortierella sp. GBA30]